MTGRLELVPIVFFSPSWHDSGVQAGRSKLGRSWVTLPINPFLKTFVVYIAVVKFPQLPYLYTPWCLLLRTTEILTLLAQRSQELLVQCFFFSGFDRCTLLLCLISLTSTIECFWQQQVLGYACFCHSYCSRVELAAQRLLGLGSQRD